jgi:hypothetical protein
MMVSIAAFEQTVVEIVALAVALTGHWGFALDSAVDALLHLFAAHLLGWV